MRQVSLSLFITIFLLLAVANYFFKLEPSNFDLAFLLFFGILSLYK